MAYQRVTFLELKNLAMGRLGNIAFYNRELEIPLYLNEALRLWNVLTGQWKGMHLYQTVANQTFYVTSGQFLKVMRVAFNGKPLDLTSLFSLDNGRPGWQADSSVPDRWFPVGLTQIGLYPAHATGLGSLKVEGLQVAPILVNDTDYLDLGEWQVQALLDYVQHVASFKQGGKEFEATSALLQNFTKAAGVQNAKFGASSAFRRMMGMDLDEHMNPVFKEASSGGNGSKRT